MERENDGGLADEIIPPFTALQNSILTLHLITPENLESILERVKQYAEADYFTREVAS
jgi:hypothetical protein